MNKEAKTNLELHPLLKRRWSPRAYTEQAVEKEWELNPRQSD